MSDLLNDSFWIFVAAVGILGFLLLFVFGNAFAGIAEWWEAKQIIRNGRSVSWQDATESTKCGTALFVVASWRFPRKIWLVERELWRLDLARAELLRRHGKIVVGVPRDAFSVERVKGIVGQENVVDLSSLALGR